MSHPDATTALKIYKRFCQQTEKVVTYLSVAKKMQNIIKAERVLRPIFKVAYGHLILLLPLLALERASEVICCILVSHDEREIEDRT